jgi:hypothetical protein
VNRKNKIFIQTDAKKTGFYIEIQKYLIHSSQTLQPDKILGREKAQKDFISIFFNNLHPR